MRKNTINSNRLVVVGNVMKQTFLIIIATIWTITTYACKCRILKFSEEVAYADQIFIGTVIKKTASDMAYYLFSISRSFKGDKTDTVTIKTGFGGPDCGMEFETGKEYLVYSHNKKTSRCRRNALASNNPDLNKIKYLFNSNFSATVGETANPDLTENEAVYFNSEIQRRDFDFHGKKVAFVLGTSFIDKEKYFENYGGNEVVANLVILTERKAKSKWL